jgi:selenium-binding protein 1
MATWTPDPTFYPSPTMAMAAPRETLGYVAILNPGGSSRPDALGVLDLDPASSTYGEMVDRAVRGNPADGACGTDAPAPLCWQ